MTVAGCKGAIHPALQACSRHAYRAPSGGRRRRMQQEGQQFPTDVRRSSAAELWLFALPVVNELGVNELGVNAIPNA